MFVVRGENVYPSAIEDIIRDIDGFCDEYRIVITREKTMDELIVQTECLPGVDECVIPDLKDELENRLKAAGLRTNVVLVAPGSLERTEFKARRVIDQRDLYDEIITKCQSD
jgi:phenylacetate-CoA ligase